MTAATEALLKAAKALEESSWKTASVPVGKLRLVTMESLGALAVAVRECEAENRKGPP